MISTVFLNMERVIVLWEDRFFFWLLNQRIYCPMFGESFENLTYIVLSHNVWYLVGIVNSCVGCRRHMETPYPSPCNPYKFVHKMSKHHKLLPMWDLCLFDWLNSIGKKTHRFVPHICFSMPSTLAQLPTHRTSSSPIWLQLKSRRMMVWLMHTASAKT